MIGANIKTNDHSIYVRMCDSCVSHIDKICLLFVCPYGHESKADNCGLPPLLLPTWTKGQMYAIKDGEGLPTHIYISPSTKYKYSLLAKLPRRSIFTTHHHTHLPYVINLGIKRIGLRNLSWHRSLCRWHIESLIFLSRRHLKQPYIHESKSRQAD